MLALTPKWLPGFVYAVLTMDHMASWLAACLGKALKPELQDAAVASLFGNCGTKVWVNTEAIE